MSILASVRSKSGALISTLTKDDFKIYEDGKEQQIKNFTRETDLPLTLGLLVDTSSSQERLIDTEQRAASQFFKKVLREKDQAFLIQFGAEAELLQDLTNSAAPAAKRPATVAPERPRRRPASRPGADHAESSRDHSL